MKFLQYNEKKAIYLKTRQLVKEIKIDNNPVNYLMEIDGEVSEFEALVNKYKSTNAPFSFIDEK